MKHTGKNTVGTKPTTDFNKDSTEAEVMNNSLLTDSSRITDSNETKASEGNSEKFLEGIIESYQNYQFVSMIRTEDQEHKHPETDSGNSLETQDDYWLDQKPDFITDFFPGFVIEYNATLALDRFTETEPSSEFF